MAKWIYFTDEEVQGLDNELVAKLDQARHISGVAYEITSGYRSGDENGIDNGVRNSAHMQRKAVDLRCHDSVTRFKIFKGLYAAGFRRIGLNSIHIHADIDPTKPQTVFWI